MLITIKQDNMAEDNKIGFKGLGSYGNNNKSIVKPKDELNSGTSTSYSKVMSSGKSSSDPFHGLNEPLAKRVQAFNDRRQMRRDAKTERLVGGKGMIKSSFTPVAGQDTKLYNKNQKLEDKLNERLGYKKSIDKKNLKPGSTGGLSVAKSTNNNTSTSSISSISGASTLASNTSSTTVKPAGSNNTKPVSKKISKYSTDDVDTMIKIKSVDPKMSDDRAKKILEAAKGYENETIEDIVASYNKYNP